jgi:arsenate reductase-like glutaredoxin family protein
MNLFNKIFSGGQIEKPIAPTLPTNQVEELSHEPLHPLYGVVAGEAEPTQIYQPTSTDTAHEVSQAFEQQFGNLDIYELLQSKLNVAELTDIYTTLEGISNTVRNLNQSQQNSDEHLETWQPLTANIDAFITKKKQLQIIEKQMNQTISEMHELHQKMIDSIGAVRDYNSERAQMYLERKKIADELGRKLL